MSSVLKIIQIIDQLDAGGAERVMVDLSNILSTNGNNVTTLAIINHGELEKELNSNIKRIDLNRQWKFNPAKMKQLSMIIKQHDIAHVHMRHNLKYVWLAKFLFPFKTPIIFHDHYGRINIDNSVGKMLSEALKKTTYIGVSRQLCDWAVKEVGLSREKVFHLSNIVVKKQGNINTNKNNDSWRLIIVSNIRREKNIEFALSIVQKLKKTHDLTLDIYGKVVDDLYFKELRDKITQWDIKENIQFIHNCIDIQSRLSQYHMALHTAKSETGPLVLIEYLSQGLPFLSFKTGEVIKQIGKDLPEFILDNFDVERWINQLNTIIKLNDQDKIIETYHKHYSEEKYYNQCLEIYKKSLTY